MLPNHYEWSGQIFFQTQGKNLLRSLEVATATQKKRLVGFLLDDDLSTNPSKW